MADMTQYPRCGTCKHWREFAPYREWGTCNLIQEWDTGSGTAIAHIDSDDIAIQDASLDTHQSFGCVLHEPRNEPGNASERGG